MALIQVNYLSRALFRTVPVNVVLPADRVSLDGGGYAMRPGQRFKTLVLLHGLLGNYTDWVSGTRIQRWAEERSLAVIMPSGDNSFYIDSLIRKVLDWLPLDGTDGGLGSGNVGRR